jgi:16S rRNA (adenine1518-N6/adenine1519-N6)-dimethyltransferase
VSEKRPPGGFGPPRKRFGQHFLTDPRALDRIVEALEPESTPCVVEIGPGRGALTERLLQRCERLVAVEIDRDLVRHLREAHGARSGFAVVEGDALEEDWAALAGGPYRLAGNLPYNITTPLIFRILAPPRPERSVILVQKEVADRLAATAGSADYGALTVNVQVVARVEVAGRVGAGSFHPRPAVDSAIVVLEPLPEPLVTPYEEATFRRFVQAVFGMRRKQSVRVVRELTDLDAEGARAVLASLGVDPVARPETLGPTVFVSLFRALGGPRIDFNDRVSRE